MGGVFRAVTRIFRRPKQVIIQQPAKTQPATVDAPAPTDAKTSSLKRVVMVVKQL